MNFYHIFILKCLAKNIYDYLSLALLISVISKYIFTYLHFEFEFIIYIEKLFSKEKFSKFTIASIVNMETKYLSHNNNPNSYRISLCTQI